jgi:exonuclease SbcD
MIKFLHTADLHLGKVFHDLSLIEDQKYMLDQLADILRDESYAALVIAGDVYDRSIPPPEAVDLFGSFLARLKKNRPSLDILVIPGNHDSPVRLGFGRELFAGLGIHFAADTGDAVKPVVIGERDCAFFLLPFAAQAEINEEAAAELEKARLTCVSPGTGTSVLAAHLFAAGGSGSDSERIILGSAGNIDINLFKGFDYIALGHLHRYQRAGKNGFYSGSPLAYSFAEAGAEKFFLSVELDGGKNKLEKIPVKPLRRLTRLSGPFERFFNMDQADAELTGAKDDYLEITLTGRQLTENALALLKKNFPGLLSIRQEEAFSALENRPDAAPENAASGKQKNLDDDFADFLAFLYGSAEESKLELFRKLLSEIEAESYEA